MPKFRLALSTLSILALCLVSLPLAAVHVCHGVVGPRVRRSHFGHSAERCFGLLVILDLLIRLAQREQRILKSMMRERDGD